MPTNRPADAPYFPNTTSPADRAAARRRRIAADQADQVAAAVEAARKALGVETLETRNADGLDFVELHVATIRALVEAAFLLGQQTPAPRV